ncbi:NnrS family protein [Roseomonas sp. CAU 1739]|uniref:NnrS family protein n=1 Tax=Roseomonas sp. CAU 1739 TaxID=3140364 RepID=UPI00325B59DB
MSAATNPPGRGVASVAAPRRGLRFALLAQGFRPFFLLSGIWALLGVALWASALSGMPVPEGPLPLVRWHGHEMLAGFVGAAMVGFLLTAVPNWTGRRGHAGASLAILVTVVLAGRLALLPGSPLPTGIAVAIALAGLPTLLLLLLPSLAKAGQPRLFGPPLIVLLFWGGDLLMLGGTAGWWAADTWRLGQLLSANAALALVGLIGGRIVPSFTLNALRKTGRPAEPAPLPGVDRAAVLSLLSVVVIDLVLPDSMAAGGVAALAAILVGLRLSRWHGLRTLGLPIVWVLHLAYAFVPLALATKAAFLLGGMPWAVNWLHLQGAGALALMIVAVMTRAALGHTGRDLVAAPATVLAYVLIALAALMRCFGPPLTGGALVTLMVAGVLWVAAFVLYLTVYAPVLLFARPDGKPG